MQVSEQASRTASLLNNVGIAAARDGGDALDAGIVMVRRAMALNPLDLALPMNLAALLLGKDALDEVDALATATLKRDAARVWAWTVLGVVASHRGKLGEAIDFFKRAYELEQTGPTTWDLASSYLRAGDFAKGLPLYEQRHLILPPTGPKPDAPEWKGEKTGHLVVHNDQGHGDVIMFSRFLAWARERCDKLSFFCDPAMLSLMSGFEPIADVRSVYSSDEKYDHQIRLASLPLVYGLTPHNIPPDPGMITASATKGQLGGAGLKIGIAWQGNRKFPGDGVRSIPFREFLPLAADPRNTVISLQCGADSGDIGKARATRIVRDMSPDIDGEWSHTAAVIKNLDLVVSSCTAIPHLSGALGVPTFIMIPVFADWRWLHGRDDTPWYPNTRLFRQTKVGKWDDVVARVVGAIGQMHQRRAIVDMLNRGTVENVVTEYEPEVASLMRKVLRPGDCFVDVGAAEGLHSRRAAVLVGSHGHVIACEPGEQNLHKLRECPGPVEIVGQPLSRTEGEVTFYLNQDNENNALWDPRDWPGPENPTEPKVVTLPATTLDALMKKRPAPRLVKIDTEGAEQLILEGARRLLVGTNKPPYVVAELHEFGLEKLGGSQKELREYMRVHGYETWVLHPDGSRPTLVKPEHRVRSSTIVNLLYASEAAVEEAWGKVSDAVDQWAAA